MARSRSGACTPASCTISQRGWDGFGHQLEAKLSCIATAEALNLSYVHIPFRRIRLRPGATSDFDDATQFEGFIGLDSIHPSWRSGMRSHARVPGAPTWWPWRDAVYGGGLHLRCHESARTTSWFGRLERGAERCCAEHVYTGDSCFDHFYCAPGWPAIWERVAPWLRGHYMAVAKPDTQWDARFAPSTEGSSQRHAHVAVHFRRGASRGLRLPAAYYAGVVLALRAMLPAPRFRIQTDATPAELRRLMRLLGGKDDVIVDTRAETPLPLAFHRMVTADVVVLARSSLSMAAALLSNGTAVFPECFLTARRPLPHWLVARCPCPASDKEQRCGARRDAPANASLTAAALVTDWSRLVATILRER